MNNKFTDRRDSNYHLVRPQVNNQSNSKYLLVEHDLLVVLDWNESDLLRISRDEQGNYQLNKIHGTTRNA